MLGTQAPAEDADAIRDWFVTWQSTGTDKKGDPFPRPGRAAVMFGARPRVSWKGLHTHISLNPGTPQDSHGNRPEIG